MVRLRIPDADREIWSWRPSSRTNGVEIKQPCMSADARSHEHRRDHIRGTKNSRRVDRCWGAGEVRLRKGYSDVIADLIRIPTGPCGFGRAPPDPRWPGNARVAVQLVANFKEGAENSSSHGPRACALPALSVRFLCQRGRINFVWRRSGKPVSAGGRICRSHTARRQACRPAGGKADVAKRPTGNVRQT